MDQRTPRLCTGLRDRDATPGPDVVNRVQSLLHHLEPVGHMYCRFSIQSWSCIGIQCTGERTPVHGVVHRMSKCTGEMTPAHWTAASLHENTLHSTAGRGACSTGQDFVISQTCIQNRMTRECRSPCTCFPHDMHHKNVRKVHCMHVQCIVPTQHSALHATACSPDKFHTHWHPWGFPWLISALPHVFTTANPLTSAFAAPL